MDGFTRLQRTYDHRLRDLVRSTRDLTVATSAGVPRSTAAGWMRGPGRTTVTLDALSKSEQDLQAEVLRLRRRAHKLCALARSRVVSRPAMSLPFLAAIWHPTVPRRLEGPRAGPVPGTTAHWAGPNRGAYPLCDAGDESIRLRAVKVHRASPVAASIACTIRSRPPRTTSPSRRAGDE